MPAIYPNPTLSLREAKEDMRKKNYDAWVQVYEHFYDKKLVYAETEEEK